MFLGSYLTLFSGRNRVILPKKLRKELGNEQSFYLVMGLDGEIWGFRSTEWQEEAEKRLDIPLTDYQGREQRRRFFGQAEECILDGQSRFIIPSEFAVKADLKEEVLIIGAGDHFEIWNPKEWEKLGKREV